MTESTDDQELHRFAITLIDRLRHRDGRLEATLLDDGRVHIQDAEGQISWMDVRNAWRGVMAYADDGPRDVTAAIDRQIDLFLSRPRELPGGQTFRDSLRLVVRPVDRLRSLVQGDGRVVATRVTPDLVGLLVADLGEQMVYIDLDQLGTDRFTDPADAVPLALRQTWSHEIKPRLQVHGDGPLVITCGGNYEASILLFDQVWNALADEVRGDLVVAVPARDLVFVTGSEDPEGLAEVMAWVEDTFERDAPYLMTRRLVRRLRDRWEPWPPGPKLCDVCDRSYALDRTVCLDCDESLDSWVYGRAALLALAGGALFEAVLFGLGWRDGGVLDFLRQAFQSSVPLLLVGYPIFKGVQKLRAPERPWVRELGSVFSDRFNRLLILLVLVGVGYLGGFVLPVVPRDPTWLGWVDLIRRWVTLGGASIVVLLALLDQGVRFFDFRISNTYSARERSRVDPHE